jgi:hypothetical protein
LINQSITSAASFTVAKTYALNPGIAATFPWLSTIAGQYEQYAFRKLTFHYVPFVATSSAGTIMLMADYNAQDTPPISETQFMDHPRAVSNSLWNPVSYPVDTKAMHMFAPRRFVRQVLVAGDLKTFDSGTFNVATDNAAVAPCGKLYVEYVVELFVPQLEPSQALVPSGTAMYVRTASQTITKDVITAINTWVKTFDPWDLNQVSATGVFTPPAGIYRMAVTVTFEDTAAENSLWTMAVFKNGSIYVVNTAAETTAAATYANCSVDVVVPMNGTDYFSVSVTGNGAAGTLTVFSSMLTVSLA